MATIFDVEPLELIMYAKEELKKYKELTPPDWAKFVKTGVHKERPPMQEDWWYIRAAAILRYLYKVGRPIGIERLRKKYGGAKTHMHKPGKHVKGSGKIIRTILQQLEAIGFVKKVEKPRPGRIITPEGRSFLDKIATKIFREKFGNVSPKGLEGLGEPIKVESKKEYNLLEEYLKSLKKE